MKVALIYDRVNKWGGAERVLLTLHEMFPAAPLYTAVYSPDTARWAHVFPQIHTSFLQKIPLAHTNHELLGALTPLAFEQFNFNGFDLVISVTSEAGKGIITHPRTKHLCYCLTPTRYLWSGYEEYLNHPGRLNWIPFYRFFARPILSYARKWDQTASARPDFYVAISTAVEERIRKYYNRRSEIVFPPVDTAKFAADQGKKLNLPADYYLMVGRLVPYKRPDLVISAFNKIGLPLVIVGTGSEEQKLKKLAGKNITFAGFVPEDDLSSYYHRATALIFPQEEDFGIVPVEAMASGLPVIAYNQGGSRDTVVDGKTGIFFKEQTVDSLIAAVKTYRKTSFSKEICRKQAEKFSVNNFKKSFNSILKKVTTQSA